MADQQIKSSAYDIFWTELLLQGFAASRLTTRKKAKLKDMWADVPMFEQDEELRTRAANILDHPVSKLDQRSKGKEYRKFKSTLNYLTGAIKDMPYSHVGNLMWWRKSLFYDLKHLKLNRKKMILSSCLLFNISVTLQRRHLGGYNVEWLQSEVEDYRVIWERKNVSRMMEDHIMRLYSEGGFAAENQLPPTTTREQSTVDVATQYTGEGEEEKRWGGEGSGPVKICEEIGDATLEIDAAEEGKEMEEVSPDEMCEGTEHMGLDREEERSATTPPLQPEALPRPPTPIDDLRAKKKQSGRIWPARHQWRGCPDDTCAELQESTERKEGGEVEIEEVEEPIPGREGEMAQDLTTIDTGQQKDRDKRGAGV